MASWCCTVRSLFSKKACQATSGPGRRSAILITCVSDLLFRMTRTGYPELAFECTSWHFSSFFPCCCFMSPSASDVPLWWDNQSMPLGGSNQIVYTNSTKTSFVLRPGALTFIYIMLYCREIAAFKLWDPLFSDFGKIAVGTVLYFATVTIEASEKNNGITAIRRMTMLRLFYIQLYGRSTNLFSEKREQVETSRNMEQWQVIDQIRCIKCRKHRKPNHLITREQNNW